MSNVQISTWRTCLDTIQTVPPVSTTFASVHMSEIAHEIQNIANRMLNNNQGVPAPMERPVGILSDGLNYSTEVVFKSAGRAVITYLALTALAPMSLLVNGVVGAGKVTLGLLIGVATQAGTEKYRDAQNLLEQGVFHVASGVSDFAIGYFSVVAGAFAVLNGLAPLQTKELVGQAFIWKGAILRADNAGQADVEKDRKDYSWLQILADRVQRFVLPDEGAGRLQAFFEPRSQAV